MKRLFLLGLVMTALTGCATVQPNVALSEDFWSEKDKTVAVVVTQLPQADYMTTGQQGLLDLAINEGANSALNDHLHALDISEFHAVGEEFAQMLREQGMAVVGPQMDFELPKLASFRGKGAEGEYGRKDYRALRERAGADRLLLIQVPQAGVVRPYYGFFPTGEPLASFVTEGRLIDLDTNRILWRAHFDTKMAIQAPWDEPPTFPNVTTAVYKSLEQARVTLRNDFRVMPQTTESGSLPAVSKPR